MCNIPLLSTIGHYVYMEVSGAKNENARAVLTSQSFPALNTHCALEFWYHAFGSSVGSLSVSIKLYCPLPQLILPLLAHLRQCQSQVSRKVDRLLVCIADVRVTQNFFLSVLFFVVCGRACVRACVFLHYTFIRSTRSPSSRMAGPIASSPSLVTKVTCGVR